MKKDSRVKAIISLDAVEHNFREMRKNIAEDTKMIAVIKADAYGHGAVPVAHLIEDYDYIWGFAAATAEEAIHLRQAGITKPILILGIVFDEYYPELVQYEIRPAVCEYEEAKKLLRANRDKLDRIAKFLYEKETITGKQFMEIYHKCDEPEEEQESGSQENDSQENVE